MSVNAMAVDTSQTDGSTTVGPIGDAFAETFKDKASITVSKTGSGDGATARVEGRCDIAMMSRFMKGSEYKAAVKEEICPVAHAIAMDGTCLIVHLIPLKNGPVPR